MTFGSTNYHAYHVYGMKHLPAMCLEKVFEYLTPGDIFNCMLVCRQWYSVTQRATSQVWRSIMENTLPKAALGDVQALKILATPKNMLRAYLCSWNPEDLSPSMCVEPNGFQLYRRPIAQCTDGARARKGFRSGVHAFDFIWQTPYGTSAIIGVATGCERLQAPGYDGLIGRSRESWGWNLVENKAYHSDKGTPYPETNNAPTIKRRDKVRMILDCDQHMLGFEYGDEFLGIAFKNLRDVKLYPAISAVYGHTTVCLYYQGPAEMG